MIDIKSMGCPVPLMSFDDSNKIKINNAILEKIFNDDEVKNCKIVTLSVIGAFRGGKSFLLGYCLRFLYAHYPSLNNPNPRCRRSTRNWMGDKMAPLEGFEWQFGMERVTSGIIMWNDVFFHTNDETGEKIAILLLDTQGLFDNQTTSNDNFRVFALGTLLSSIQIFNISTRIQEDQLQYLQFATDFAQCFGSNHTSSVSQEKPFQKLIFLVRDFPYPEDFSYGIDGGNKYIKKLLFDNQCTHKQELASVRQQITSTFDQICCCLLPHPGSDVGQVYKYDGSWSKMDKKFREEFREFIETILEPKNLITKKINSIEVNGREMKNYIDKYFQLFQSDNVPQVKNIADATIDNFMNDLVDKCMDEFILVKDKWEDIGCTDKIPQIYEDCKTKVLDKYDNAKKMGNANQIKKFKQKLKNKLRKIYKLWQITMVQVGIEKQKKLDDDNASINTKNENLIRIINFVVVTGIVVLAPKTESNITTFFYLSMFDQIKSNFSQMGISSKTILAAFKKFIPNDEVLVNLLKNKLNLNGTDKKNEKSSKIALD